MTQTLVKKRACRIMSSLLIDIIFYPNLKFSDTFSFTWKIILYIKFVDGEKNIFKDLIAVFALTHLP
jgi:hypothetical protein